MTAVEKVIAAAKAEVGYLEKRTNSQLADKTANTGYNNYTKYAADLDAMGNIYNGAKNGYYWCDVFVDWLFITTFGKEIGMKMLYQPYGGLGAGCTYSAQYFKNNGAWHTTPQLGDQIFFAYSNDGYDHTGIVVKVENEKVYTIEGNTSGGSGVVDNGGGVFEKSYSLSNSQIGGYGRPNYSLIKEEDTVTYEQWKEFQSKYEAEQSNKATSDWARNAISYVKDNGIMSGDNNGRFRPQSEITRQEVAQVFYNFNGAEKDASDWAKDSWDKAVATGLFDGTSPRAPLTREQFAVILGKLGLVENTTAL